MTTTPARLEPDIAPDDCPGHCGCGQPFDHYTDWAHHAQTAGCRHWRLDRPIPKENPAA